MSDSLPKLSGKIRIWADAYVGEARFNASEAARIAGYKNPRVSGQENLRKPAARAYIEDVLKQSAVTRDELLVLVAQDARRNEDDIFEITTKTGSEIVQSSVVSSLISARTSARTNLMKAFGMFTENIAVSGSLRREIVVVDPDDE